MNTRDKHQTANQYKKRKKRIAQENEYTKQINTIESDIFEIDKKIEKLKRKKEGKEKEKEELKTNELTDLLITYNNDVLLSEIISDGKETTFPASLLDELEQKRKKGFNKDNISLDDLKALVEVDKQIQKEFQHTNCITDAIGSLGNLIDTSDKKGGNTSK